jgi:flagellar FliL protein
LADAGNTGGKKGGVVALVLATFVAAGAGAAHGVQTYRMIEGRAPAPAAGAEPEPVAAAEPAAAAGHGHGAPAPAAPAKDGARPKLPSKLVTRDLQPLITNIVMPPDLWVRLEATVVYDQAEIDNPEVMMAEVSGDLLGYLRTLTLRELQGADGLMFLRQDLKERVALRTQNKVRDLVIQALVVQ